MTFKKLGILFLITFCFAFFYWDTIVSSSLKWSIQWVLKRQNAELRYDSFEVKDSVITIDHPVIEGLPKNQTLEARQLEIRYHIGWLSRTLSLDIHVDTPEVDITEQQLRWKHLFNERGKQFFKLHTRLEIDNGKINLFAFEDDATAERSYTVHGRLSFDEGVQAECLIACHDEQQTQPQLKLIYSQTPEGQTQLNFDAHEAEAKTFADLLKLVFPSLKSWSVNEGLISGKMTFSESPGSPPYAEGKIYLQGLIATQDESGLIAVIDDAHLDLKPENLKPGLGESPQTLIPVLTGELKLNQKGSFTIEKGGEALCQLVLNACHVRLLPDQKTDIQIQGLLHQGDASSELNLKGHIAYANRKSAEAILVLDLQHAHHQHAQITTKIQEIGLPQWSAEFHCNSVGKPEFTLVQHILQSYAPQFDHFVFHEGSVDAFIKAYFNAGQISELKLESINAKNLNCDLPKLELVAGALGLKGHGSINLAYHTPQDTLKGEFELSQGEIRLTGINQEFWHFTNINSNIAIHQGMVRESDASIEVAGLKGSAHLDWGNPQEIMRITLNGKAKDLVPFVPEMIKQAIDNKFADDAIQVDTKIKRYHHGGRVQGEIVVDSGSASEKILFGFDLERIAGTGAEKNNDINWENLLPNFVKLAVPHITRPVGTFQAPWMQKGLSVGDLTLRNGWFEAKDLPLNKYVEPFLFRNHSFKLMGRSDCKINFDHREITIRYNGRQVYFDLEPLTVEVSKVPAGGDAAGDAALPAFHYFDLISNTNFGFIPIQNGSYFDKKTGLLFTDVTGDLILDGEKFHIPNIEGYCCGVNMAGQVDADFTSPLVGVGEIDISAHNIQGKVSQVQQILSHFDESLFFLKVPLDGNISTGLKGGELHFSINPEHDEITGFVQGSVSDGEIASENGDFTVKDLSFNFDFDEAQKKLAFTDFLGTLLLGPPSNTEEFVLAGQGLCFHDYIQKNGDFDIWIGDKAKDILRLAGKTYSQENPLSLNNSPIIFALDHDLTHFGAIHPVQSKLILKDWSTVDALQLDFDFTLSTLIHELEPFRNTGLLFLNPHFLDKLNKETLAGDIKLTLNFDADTSRFIFDASGKNLSLDSYHVKNASLNGYKRGKSWIIEQCKLDDLSLGADISLEDQSWKANFLGLRYGKSVLVGLEGQYFIDSQQFKGKVNLMEADLSHLNEWKDLTPFYDEYNPQGHVSGTGTFSLVKNTLQDKWGLETDLNLALKGVSLKQFYLQDVGSLSCHYVSDQSLMLKQLNTAIFNPQQQSQQVHLNVEKIGFDFAVSELTMEGSRFNIEAQNLPWAASMLHEHFPEAINEQIMGIISHLKKDATVSGSYYVQSSPAQKSFRLSLEDDQYHLFGRDFEIKKFILQKDPEEFKITSQVLLNNHLLWLSALSQSASLEKGTVILADVYPDPQNAFSVSPPLTIQWKKLPDQGFVIPKADGALGGLHFHLTSHEGAHPHPKGEVHLTGEILIDGRKAKDLFAQPIAEAFKEWKIGSGYTLKGEWIFDFDSKKTEELDVSFEGHIEGYAFQLKGHQLQNLTGKVYYSPGHLQITGLSITDTAGNLQVDHIDAHKEVNGEWSLLIPSTEVTNLRPSLLKSLSKSAQPKPKSFLIENLQIDNLYGYLGDKNSFTGTGHLYFVNPPKGTLHNTIFAIPAEILSRIGLNTGIMTPVKGNILFEIRDAQMQFLKFKDIYSERHLSKFNLQKSDHPYYLDFDGNLFIQVRMKQYNLLFKFTELFTVTVKGTLEKPVYTLQRQHRFTKEKNIEEYEAKETEIE